MANPNKEAINSGVASSNARMKDVIDKTHNNLTVNQNYDATPNKVLTYKDNAEWFNNKAVWREGMSDRESENVRRKVMSGGYGFNPKTGVTYKLDKKDRVDVSDEDKYFSSLKRVDKPVKSGPHFKYKDVDGTEHIFEGTAEEFKGSEEEAAYNKQWVNDTRHHANRAFSNVVGTLIPPVGAVQAVTNLGLKGLGLDPNRPGEKLKEGDELGGGDFLTAGLSALPFIPGNFSKYGSVPAKLYKGINTASTPYVAGETFRSSTGKSTTEKPQQIYTTNKDLLHAKNLKQKENTEPKG